MMNGNTSMHPVNANRYENQQLCQHCSGMYRLPQRQTNKYTGVSLDTSSHPGFTDFKTLAESGKECALCLFHYEDAMKMVWISWSARDRPHKHFTAIRGVKLSLGVESDSPRYKVTVAIENEETFEVIRNYQLVNIGTAEEVEAGRAPYSLPLVRPVSVHPADARSLSTMRSWIDLCDKHHEPCRQDSNWDSPPARLLFVGTRERPELRLVLNDASARRRYIALSHCWGQGQEFVLNTQNCDSWQTLICEDEAPKTFQDAFRLARLLDVQFVWIDSLCIKQDDRRDWDDQSVKMGRVYKQAFVTIAASCSAGDTEGFLHDRPPAAVRIEPKSEAGAAQQLAHITASEERWQYSKIREQNNVHSSIQYEPLSKRGWAVQERILSRRSISFGHRQAIWQCKTMVAFEDGRISSVQAYHQHGIEPWKDIVELFTSCSLTYASDKLPALSGVAAEIAHRTGDTYLAGHWLRDLPSSLLWTVKPGEQNSPAHCERSDYHAPSWSWASLDSAIEMPQVRNDRPLAKLIHHDVRVVSGANPFGAVMSGRLVLSVPMRRLKYNEPGRSGFRGPHELSGSRFRFDRSSDREVSEVFVAVLERGSGLLLIPWEDEEQVYKRIGVVDHHSADFKYEEMEVRQIVLK